MPRDLDPPKDPVPSDPGPGLRNLLANCIGLKPGQHFLLIEEPEGQGYYRDEIGAATAALAAGLGAKVTVLRPALIDDPRQFPADVLDAIAAADHTLFFSRIGTTARFLALPGPGSKTVSYALDAQTFAAPFGTLPYGFLQGLHDALVARIRAARRYRLTSAAGTDLVMDLTPDTLPPEAVLTNFSVRNFPLMIYPPISAARASGRLVLELALLPTGVREYPDPVLPLSAPLVLDVEDGRITGFHGAQAAQAKAHFDRVAQAVQGDGCTVNSWHSGLNPATFYAGRALDDPKRWGNVVFGSPRYTHFHLVGSDPGDICGSVFDATVTYDDEVLWDRGHLAFLDRPEIVALAQDFGVDLAALSAPQPIGV